MSYLNFANGAVVRRYSTGRYPCAVIFAIEPQLGLYDLRRFFAAMDGTKRMECSAFRSFRFLAQPCADVARIKQSAGRRRTRGSVAVATGRAILCLIIVFVAAGAVPCSSHAGGVTFITHGLNGNTDGWITGMANRITNYSRFPGTKATIYKAYFYSTNSGYALTATRVAGSIPSASDSGEIVIKFDW